MDKRMREAMVRTIVRLQKECESLEEKVPKEMSSMMTALIAILKTELPLEEDEVYKLIGVLTLLVDNKGPLE